MFFYLHCGPGFNSLHGGRTKRCLISRLLCGNRESNFCPHKVPRHTCDTWISQIASHPMAEHKRHRRWVRLKTGQCLLWRVSSLKMFVDVWADLPIGTSNTRFWGLGGSAHTQGCSCCPVTLPISSSSSELLAEKSGLAGGVLENLREEGPACCSSVSPHA